MDGAPCRTMSTPALYRKGSTVSLRQSAGQAAVSFGTWPTLPQGVRWGADLSAWQDLCYRCLRLLHATEAPTQSVPVACLSHSASAESIAKTVAGSLVLVMPYIKSQVLQQITSFLVVRAV